MARKESVCEAQLRVCVATWANKVTKQFDPIANHICKSHHIEFQDKVEFYDSMLGKPHMLSNTDIIWSSRNRLRDVPLSRSNRPNPVINLQIASKTRSWIAGVPGVPRAYAKRSWLVWLWACRESVLCVSKWAVGLGALWRNTELEFLGAVKPREVIEVIQFERWNAGLHVIQGPGISQIEIIFVLLCLAPNKNTQWESSFYQIWV